MDASAAQRLEDQCSTQRVVELRHAAIFEPSARESVGRLDGASVAHSQALGFPRARDTNEPWIYRPWRWSPEGTSPDGGSSPTLLGGISSPNTARFVDVGRREPRTG